MAFSRRSRAFRPRDRSAPVWDLTGCVVADLWQSGLRRASDLLESEGPRQGRPAIDLISLFPGNLLRPTLFPYACVMFGRRYVPFAYCYHFSDDIPL